MPTVWLPLWLWISRWILSCFFFSVGTNGNSAWTKHFCVVFPKENLLRFFVDEEVLYKVLIFDFIRIAGCLQSLVLWSLFYWSKVLVYKYIQTQEYVRYIHLLTTNGRTKPLPRSQNMDGERPGKLRTNRFFCSKHFHYFAWSYMPAGDRVFYSILHYQLKLKCRLVGNWKIVTLWSICNYVWNAKVQIFTLNWCDQRQ